MKRPNRTARMIEIYDETGRVLTRQSAKSIASGTKQSAEDQQQLDGLVRQYPQAATAQITGSENSLSKYVIEKGLSLFRGFE